MSGPFDVVFLDDVSMVAVGVLPIHLDDRIKVINDEAPTVSYCIHHPDLLFFPVPIGGSQCDNEASFSENFLATTAHGRNTEHRHL